MKRMSFAMCVFLLCLLCTGAHAYTLTFDQDTAGSYPFSAFHAGAYFDGSFTVVDHSSSDWGLPHSPNNVLMTTGFLGSEMLKFRTPPNLVEPYSVYSLGAYFSTELGTVIRIDGCHGTTDNVIASAVIGSSTASWNNVYVEINDPLGRIDGFMFYSVSSTDALQHWSADDMTIVPVPEPSSLLALLAGLGGLGALLRRRVG